MEEKTSQLTNYSDERRYLVNPYLMKNRLGPFWIVVKCGDMYLGSNGQWIADKTKALHYRNGDTPSMGLKAYRGDGIYLTTAAGDICLAIKNMRLNSYEALK